MNKIPKDSVIVLDISPKTIEILASNQELKAIMESIGFTQSKNCMTYFVMDEGDRRKIIQSLVSYGALF